MNTKLIKSKLQKGEVSIGSWMQSSDASIAEIIASAAYDWIAIDLEHANISHAALPDLFRSLSLGGAVPMARVAQNNSVLIKQALDAGAKGLIVPQIERVSDLHDLMRWSKYPPEGERGVGFSRANLFGKNFESYFSSINRELMIVIQIESIRAVQNLQEMLQSAAVDAVLIGPYDLSASLGIVGQFQHKKFIDTMNTICSIMKKFKVPLGIHIVQPDYKELCLRIEEGFRFIAYGMDTTFLLHASPCPYPPRNI